MTITSPRLNLPYIQANQAQKHITHNEGMRVLDSITQLSVISHMQSAPPDTPQVGDRYIVPAGATGEWAGHEQAVADWDINAWVYYPPQKGWRAWDQSQNPLIIWDGENWAQLDLQNMPRLGIQATADDYNRMVVSSAAALFNHDASGGHQLKINKQAAENTASLLFQTDFAGRAEIGLAGGDDLTFKASKDGADFKTALQIDHATGRDTFPNGVLDYSAPRGGNLFANSTLALGTAYNYPANFIYDASQSPDMRAVFTMRGMMLAACKWGNISRLTQMGFYQLSCYIMQQDMAGD